MYKKVSVPHSTNHPYLKQKVTLWNTGLFRIGFTPVLRVLLGGQISALSAKVKSQHIALYLREKGHLLLLMSQEKGTPLQYQDSIPLTQVDLDSPYGRSDDHDCKPFLKKPSKFKGRVVELVLRRELKGVLVIFSSNGNSDSEFQNIKTKPYLRTITIFLSLLSLLLRDRQHFSRLQIINRISQKIDSPTDEDKLYDNIVFLIQSSFNYDHVAIYLIDKKNKQVIMKALAGKYSKITPKDQIIKFNQGIVGWVASNGKTLLSNEARKCPFFLNTTPDQIPTEAELCVPIRADGEIIGVLNIEHSELLYFDKEDINSVELLADRIGVAVKNARLYTELHKSHVTLEAISSSVGYGIMMIDREFRVQWVNRTVGEWGFVDAIGKPCHHLLNKEKDFCGNCPSINTFNTGRVSRTLFNSFGDKCFTITAAPITDSKGIVTHVLEVVEDVTKIIRSREEIESLRRDLVRAQQIASVGEIAANIVHEVRNPMNAITQALGILNADLVLKAEQEQLMNILREEFSRLNDTLNAYHILAHKKEEMKFIEDDLKPVIEKLINLIKTDQDISKRISFKMNNEISWPRFQFDINSVKQVFWNLLLNAVESIKGNGEIALLTKYSPQVFQISVEDNGSGIKENQLTNIFDPFFTTKTQGTGLGLTIVQRIIAEHNWKIKVDNVIPHGTRFTILIPIKS